MENTALPAECPVRLNENVTFFAFRTLIGSETNVAVFAFTGVTILYISFLVKVLVQPPRYGN